MTRTLRLLFFLLAGGALFGSGVRPALAQTQYLIGPHSQKQAGVPQGKTFGFDLTASPKYYPGAKSTITVYVPSQYTPDKPACLCVGLDGPNYLPQTVFDNLIFHKQMPVTVGVFISSGTVTKPGTNEPLRFDRCYQFDSTNDTFARFLTEEVLPAVERHATPDGQPIHLSADPNDHMIYGGSSGGVCAWTAAWQRPDLFRRVFTAIGTYVGMRGADTYPTLVRKTEPKPIRIFLQDGAQDTWNPLFDNWYTQNRSMEESLSFAGYDVNHSWGALGHEGSHAQSLFPDVVKWLWRDYPQPIVAGQSGNSMLRTVLVQGEAWRSVNGSFKSPDSLAAGMSGDVYFNDAVAKTVYKIGAGGVPGVFARSPAPITAEAAGPDGRLYAASGDGRILAYSSGRKPAVVAAGVHARALLAVSDGRLYAAVPGAHDDMPSRIWLIGPGGAKTLLDTGLRRAAGLAMTPDHNLLFAAEGRTHWVYSYVLQPDGRLADKQRFYWLHTAESADEADDGSGASDMAEDAQGNLYVATRMGVQVCDRNGRVEGILTLPQGSVTSLCFGGKSLDTLYAVCGGRLYARRLAVHGVAPASAPVPLPPFGGG